MLSLIFGLLDFCLKEFIWDKLNSEIIINMQIFDFNMNLNKFLVKAKRSTYANGGESEKKILKDKSRELFFEEDDFRYRDRYFGHDPFMGEEIVWEKNKIVWGMNYYGKIILNNISSKKIYEFLKDALKRVTTNMPFRGPKKFQKEEFTYINEVIGDFSNFSGEEIIYYKKKKIYFLQYHGGLITSK